MTVKWSNQSFLGMNGWDLRLHHYSTPEVDSELLRLLDLVQLWLGVAFLAVLASFETTTNSALIRYTHDGFLIPV